MGIKDYISMQSGWQKAIYNGAVVLYAEKWALRRRKMKDRYLFKAKRIDNGEWIVGNIVYSEDSVEDFETIIIPTKNSNMYSNEKSLGFENWHKVDPTTICQCTGLRDWNNRLIWERDIVSVPSYLGKYLVEWQEDVAGFVMTEDGLTIDFDNVWDYQVEIVGNIFDNWELLEV